MTTYVTSVTDPHEQTEELQWATILGRGDARNGMLLVFVQKLCTALHEYGPSHAAGVLPDGAWSFVMGRILARIDKVLELARDNDLTAVAGMAELVAVREEIRRLDAMPELNELAGRIHDINHRICDGLADPTNPVTS